MDIWNFISAIGASVLVLAALWMAFMVVALRVIESRQLEEPDQEKTVTVMPLLVETEGNQFLCYHAKTMDFVCQGTTLEEIRQRFKQRYPDRSAAVVAGDQTAVTTLQQQLKDLRENSNCI